MRDAIDKYKDAADRGCTLFGACLINNVSFEYGFEDLRRDSKGDLEHDSTALVPARFTAGCSGAISGAIEVPCGIQDNVVRVTAVRSAGEGVQHRQFAGAIQLEHHALSGTTA